MQRCFQIEIVTYFNLNALMHAQITYKHFETLFFTKNLLKNHFATTMLSTSKGKTLPVHYITIYNCNK